MYCRRLARRLCRSNLDETGKCRQHSERTISRASHLCHSHCSIVRNVAICPEPVLRRQCDALTDTADLAHLKRCSGPPSEDRYDLRKIRVYERTGCRCRLTDFACTLLPLVFILNFGEVRFWVQLFPEKKKERLATHSLQEVAMSAKAFMHPPFSLHASSSSAAAAAFIRMISKLFNCSLKRSWLSEALDTPRPFTLPAATLPSFQDSGGNHFSWGRSSQGSCDWLIFA